MVTASHSRFATVTGGTVTDQGANTAAGTRFVDPTVGDYRRARELAASGEVPLARLPRTTVPLERAPAVLLGRDGLGALKITVDVEGTSQ